jgi:Uma2 family endonuclease
MTQIVQKQKLLTVREFLELKPDSNQYELHNGVIVEMSQPKGKHEQVTGFLTVKIGTESTRLNLPYFIPKTALVKSSQNDSCFSPDVLVVNTSNLGNEELWSDYSTLQLAESMPLVIEVVSTNWQDDYYMKLGEYEAIKIIEYWIVDYAALGARKFIGNPKKPTISIYQLVDGEYVVTHFRDDDLIVSPTFPNLNLTANQIFNASF